MLLLLNNFKFELLSLADTLPTPDVYQGLGGGWLCSAHILLHYQTGPSPKRGNLSSRTGDLERPCPIATLIHGLLHAKPCPLSPSCHSLPTPPSHLSVPPTYLAPLCPLQSGFYRLLSGRACSKRLGKKVGGGS